MKKPFTYAFLAGSYIFIIVSIIFSASNFIHVNDTIFIPMAMLSLFVLSAAIMGFLFLSEPLQLYIDGYKKEAVNFFLKTVGFFVCYLFVFVILLLIFS